MPSKVTNPNVLGESIEDIQSAPMTTGPCFSCQPLICAALVSSEYAEMYPAFCAAFSPSRTSAPPVGRGPAPRDGVEERVDVGARERADDVVLVVAIARAERACRDTRTLCSLVEDARNAPFERNGGSLGDHGLEALYGIVAVIRLEWKASECGQGGSPLVAVPGSFSLSLLAREVAACGKIQRRL